jgi:hypothetical protein
MVQKKEILIGSRDAVALYHSRGRYADVVLSHTLRTG